MIYLHRITNPRMSNSSVRSIRIFEALCGLHNAKAVAVITTMWDHMNTEGAQDAATQRDQSLRDRVDFLGGLFRHGATM